MDEKRLQEYLELIKKLLFSSTDEEIYKILVENRNLLDVGFLQTITTEIEKALNQGDKSRADRLRYFLNAQNKAFNSSPNVSKASPSVDIKQSLESLKEAEFQPYGQFLAEVLQATDESESREQRIQVIYPLLKANIDKLDANLAEVLRRWATSFFKEAEAEEAKSIGFAIGNFSILISDFPLGSFANNMEIAIAGYEVISIVFTQSTFPELWATTQNNLGIAYSDRIEGDKAENIEKAILCYQDALTVRTRNQFPQQWAMTQNNLGNAYWERIEGDKAENIEKAILCYQDALTVRTPTTLPIDCLQTARNLGDLLLEIKRWQEAIKAYDKAIQAVELSRSWAANDNRRQQILENAILVYFNIVQACINNEQPEKAIEYAERSKARNLVELLANRNLQPKGNVPEKIINKLEYLRDKIATEQQYLFNKTQDTNTNADENQRKAENQKQEKTRQRLQQLQQVQLDKLIKIEIQRYDPYFSLTQKVKPIKFEEIESLLDKRTAIIEWYIIADKIIAFIITPKPQFLFFGKRKGSVSVWESQPEDLDALFDWANKYLQDYYNEEENQNQEDKNKQWENNLNERLEELAEILHIDELITKIPQNCHRLILIPHRLLHIFPLHALEVKNKSLLELFPGGVSYAPSCQLLKLAKNQKRPDFQSLFTIKNPTEDLIFTDLEVDKISSDFQQKQTLSGKEATKDNLSQKTPQLEKIHYLHFSCHGSFNLDSPLNSYLQLADAKISLIPPDVENQRYLKLSDDEALDLEKCLTLGDLFDQEFNLNQCRLVVLSACETGLIDVCNISDEYIGLPSGFLYAGSASVVSSLWRVNDLSTAFLMIKFSQNLKAAIDKKEEISVAVALNQAQIWLKNVTTQDLQDWTNKLSLDATWKRNIRRTLKKIKPEIKPFQSPYYWAAFIAIGK